MPMAVAAWRKARCVELALAGKSYDDIAREVGYANRGTAHHTVAKALNERVDEAVEEFRQMELDRLDSLQSSQWNKAMEGDLASCNTILRIIEKRIRLLGLDGKDAERRSPRTIVLDPTDLFLGRVLPPSIR